ncbi:MAG TPA: hypothetical protein VFR65_01405 [Nitrososphaeraceae archaeon]|nr:hypothetical protein [Nitrososphaeraceae archaeon]
MRDLYNRKQKLAHWILKAKTELDEPDRTDVLQFIEYMQEKDNALNIISNITMNIKEIENGLNLIVDNPIHGGD